MKELFDRLVTLSFTDYETALKEIRDALDSGKKCSSINDGEFFFVLRPYCWFLHNPGFQDILDAVETALQALMQHKDQLMDETNPITGNEFVACGTFLASYADAGDYNPSEWKYLAASPEIAVHVTLSKYSEMLKDSNPDDSAKMKTVSDIFLKLEGLKHTAYYILRHLGNQHLEFLESLIHKFPANDQTFILHALDAFPADKAVAEFYKKYISETSSDHLRDVAMKYSGLSE